MKKLLLFTALSTLLLSSYAQVAKQVSNTKKGGQLIVKLGAGQSKGGFYKPMIFQRIPPGPNPVITTGFIKSPTNKLGIMGGLDYNYYFGKYLGASATADYFSNAYNLIEVSVPPFAANSLKIQSQKNQVNKFVGLGAIGRLPISNKIHASLGLYGGLLFRTNNNYQVDYIPGAPAPTTTVMKFSSTKAVSAFAVKGSARVGYTFNENFGASLGVEYIVPNFSFQQRFESLMHSSSATGFGVNIPNPFHAGQPQATFNNLYNTTSLVSIGYAPNVNTTDPVKIAAINLGVHYTFNKNKTKKPAKVACKQVTVVVKDQCSNIVLPNTKVILKNNDTKFEEAYTNDKGEIIFDCIKVKSVNVNGIKSDVATTEEIITAKAFENNTKQTVTLLHNDPRFTMVGSAVTLGSNAPIENVTAVITNLTNNTNRTAISNAKGEFFEQLEQNCDFKIVGQAKGKFSAVQEVSTKNLERCKDLYVRIEMPMDEIAVGKKFILNNILYDLDKDNIRPDAAKELNILVDVLKTNPTVQIELGSHTDSRQSNEYNMDLSTRRAKSAVAYLVSKGINANRIVAKGYGETQLINACADGATCTEAEHQANRRTEVKVLAF